MAPNNYFAWQKRRMQIPSQLQHTPNERREKKKDVKKAPGPQIFSVLAIGFLWVLATMMSLNGPVVAQRGCKRDDQVFKVPGCCRWIGGRGFREVGIQLIGQL